jgi:hypothetical protein
MYRLLIMGLLLISCKSSKSSCDAYGEWKFPITDTIVFEYQHIHIESMHKCYEFPTDTLILNDTIVIKYKKI